MMQVCFSKAIIILYILLLAILAILYSESLNYYKAARDISYTNVKLDKAPPPVSSFNIPKVFDVPCIAGWKFARYIYTYIYIYIYI